MLSFVTLGQENSEFPTNHEFALQEYLKFHGVTDAKLLLSNSFHEALEEVRSGRIDFLMVNAVHAEAPEIIGKYFGEVFIVDTFISPSHPLVIATRKDRQPPQSIAVLHPSTTAYVDLSAWEKHHLVSSKSLVFIAEGLLKGDYDSALIYRELAERYPDVLDIDKDLGSPDDCWILMGRHRAWNGTVIACKDAPGAKRFSKWR